MAYDPTNGETPLAELPKYGGAGGSLQAAQYYAGQDFAKMFGRNPTQSELMMLAPSYMSGDPNLTNSAQGQGAIAQYFQSLANSPTNINKQNQDKYLSEAPKYYDSINQLFESTLGRKANQDELDHFGKEIASGSADTYQLQQFLQQQPEYQTKQNEAFRNSLSDTMSANDKRYFQEQILPAIQQSYAKQGRSFDSSAFQNAATQSAQQQNTARENFLTNLTAQQYSGVQERAYNDYAAQVANQQALTNSGINAQYTGIQNTQNRLNQITDYNTQQNAYNQYLAKYGKRSSLMGGLQGAMSGAMTGGMVGGPWGAVAGAIGGGALGAYGANQGGAF